MPSTTGFEPGEILLVPFPFTDQSQAKKRPAVVISSALYNRARRDIVIMAITSQLRPSNAFGDVFVTDWRAAGLLKPSTIKPVITTIEQSLVIRKLGAFTATDIAAMRRIIEMLIG